MSTQSAKRVTTHTRDGSENGWLFELFEDRAKAVAYLTAAAPRASTGYHLRRVRTARYLCVRGGRMRTILYSGGPDWKREKHILDATAPARLFISIDQATGLENTRDEQGWLVSSPDLPYDPELVDEQVEYMEAELKAGVVT